MWAKDCYTHSWGGRGDQGGLPGGGEAGGGNGPELRGVKWSGPEDQGVSAGKEEGAEPLRCQFNPRMQSPGGAVEGGLLPARTAILGPESNQIRHSPQSPQQLRRTAVRLRAQSGWNLASCPPLISPGLPGVWAAREGGRGRGRAVVPSQKPGLKRAGPPPELCCLGAEAGLSVPVLEGLQITGKEITPEALLCTPILL